MKIKKKPGILRTMRYWDLGYWIPWGRSSSEKIMVKGVLNFEESINHFFSKAIQ